MLPAMQTGQKFFGWKVVRAGFVTAFFAWGIGFYGPPIFLQTLAERQGWPVGLLSAAITTQFLLGALVVAQLAGLHRRFGQVAVLRAGGLLTAVGLLGWALAREPWQLFLAAPLSAAGWAVTSSAALNAAIAPWFVHRRPMALGMAFNGASFGGLILSPLWVALIGGLGFPAAATLVGLIFAGLLWWMAGRFFAPTPAMLGQQPDGEALSATPAKPPVEAAPLGQNPWTEKRFLTLTAGASLALFAQIGLVAHLFSILVPLLGAGAAGLAMGGATGCAILGRMVVGRLLRPGASRRQAAALNGAVQAAGSALMLAGSFGSVPLMLAGCALFGLGIGNATSLPPLIAQRDFRAEDLPRAVALVTATGQAAYAFAPAAFGLLRFETPYLFLTAGLLQLIAGALILARR
ncbi:MFS transporter [Roseomonas sp. 18066]|uniref:MFS transporter n=1 Tax=Roseomonas sp. 18066 TaxID=2681412 RepID=UPI00190F6F66|nr:MFS transporter [Roseomonas sp. 18066]